jgi:hypothetical protein
MRAELRRPLLDAFDNRIQPVWTASVHPRCDRREWGTRLRGPCDSTFAHLLDGAIPVSKSRQKPDVQLEPASRPGCVLLAALAQLFLGNLQGYNQWSKRLIVAGATASAQRTDATRPAPR